MNPKELETYFRSGKVICPYARTASFTFMADDELSPATVGQWAHAIVSGDVGVVCATGPSRNYFHARRWCIETVCRLCVRVDGGQFAYRKGALLPYLTLGGVTLYTIGMGPQYPVAHPRYAPHLCLVSVNEDLIRSVSEHDRGPIRRAMAARTGIIYDADNVWLAIDPARSIDPQRRSP